MKLRASTFVRFEAQAVFYSIIVAITMYLLFNEVNIPKLTIICPIIGNHWWFLTTYLLLLIISPILNEGIGRLQEKQHLAIIVLFLIMNGLNYLLRREPNGSNLQSLILIYIIGQYLHRYKDSYKMFANRKMMLLVCVLCVLTNLLVVYMCLVGGHQYPKLTNKAMLYLSYSNPVIIL